MNKKAAKALEKSIEHWEENLDMLILNYLSDDHLAKDIDISSDCCPLCQLFINKYLCRGCPIFEFTGIALCGKTSWKNVNAWLSNSYYSHYDKKGVYEQGVEVITKQIEFLKSLRNN
jgi:hypothetical protein